MVLWCIGVKMKPLDHVRNSIAQYSSKALVDKHLVDVGFVFLPKIIDIDVVISISIVTVNVNDIDNLFFDIRLIIIIYRLDTISDFAYFSMTRKTTMCSKALFTFVTL